MRLITRCLALTVLGVALSGCNYVSESLLVKNKPHLEKPRFNPIPPELRGEKRVMTPQSMKNRFSYYGLDHAE